MGMIGVPTWLTGLLSLLTKSPDPRIKDLLYACLSPSPAESPSEFPSTSWCSYLQELVPPWETTPLPPPRKHHPCAATIGEWIRGITQCLLGAIHCCKCRRLVTRSWGMMQATQTPLRCPNSCSFSTPTPAAVKLLLEFRVSFGKDERSPPLYCPP